MVLQAMKGSSKARISPKLEHRRSRSFPQEQPKFSAESVEESWTVLYLSYRVDLYPLYALRAKKKEQASSDLATEESPACPCERELTSERRFGSGSVNTYLRNKCRRAPEVESGESASRLQRSRRRACNTARRSGLSNLRRAPSKRPSFPGIREIRSFASIRCGGADSIPPQPETQDSVLWWMPRAR